MAIPSQPHYHTDYSLSAFDATLERGPLEAGSEGLYETSGSRVAGCMQVAHIIRWSCLRSGWHLFTLIVTGSD
jgi:hypothetical protein